MRSFFMLDDKNEISVTENYSGYVVFYKKSKDAAIAEIQSALFSKLIENALKLNLNSFFFVDITESKARFSILKKVIDIQKCFLFGVSEKEIGINFDIPMYKLTAFASIEFLKIDAPEILENEKKLKNQLWIQLQKAFKLN